MNGELATVLLKRLAGGSDHAGLRRNFMTKGRESFKSRAPLRASVRGLCSSTPLYIRWPGAILRRSPRSGFYGSVENSHPGIARQLLAAVCSSARGAGETALSYCCGNSSLILGAFATWPLSCWYSVTNDITYTFKRYFYPNGCWHRIRTNPRWLEHGSTG